MPSGGKREAGPDKRIGRPPKSKINLSLAPKKIASDVLAMDGPPIDHTRVCKCSVCTNQQKLCRCKQPEYKEKKLLCESCTTAKEHQVCRCEICGWWDLLLSRDRRIVFDTRKYLTDRRDGKPAQGVFLGDTREITRELDFGDLPELIAASKSVAARKPN